MVMLWQSANWFGPAVACSDEPCECMLRLKVMIQLASWRCLFENMAVSTGPKSHRACCTDRGSKTTEYSSCGSCVERAVSVERGARSQVKVRKRADPAIVLSGSRRSATSKWTHETVREHPCSAFERTNNTPHIPQ